MITQIKEVNRVYVIDHDNARNISPEAHERAAVSRVQPGEILIAITGATIGKVALVPTDIGEANICSDIAKVRVDANKADPYYVFAYLSSELGQLQIRSRISGSTNEHLAPLVIENLRIPLPPEEIRNKIGELYRVGLEQLEEVRQKAMEGREMLQGVVGLPAQMEEKP